MNDKTAALVLRLVDLVASGLLLAGEAKERYDRYRSQIQTFIDEGRDPTDAEFAALLSESDHLTERIRQASQRKLAQLEQPG